MLLHALTRAYVCNIIRTGMMPLTSGSAHVFGFDVNSQMEEIRQFLGVCPQHDILFDNMTVRVPAKSLRHVLKHACV